MIAAALTRAWYGPRGWTRWLLPLACLYGAAVAVRRLAYRRGWLPRVAVGLPVIVVGNITVGGTGKTPLVAALAARLRERGLRPGIIARGYGGRVGDQPIAVGPDADAATVGDEPLLLARRSACPVVVCRRRAAAAGWLANAGTVDVVIADDGLQHYALARDAEIAVCDGARGYGNRWLLPAGPLREPLARLKDIDLTLVQARDGDFYLAPGAARRLTDRQEERPLAEFAGTPVHALAGIGNPQQFFASLRAAGLCPTGHAFPDHHRYRREDIDFGDDRPVLMTEKDAVKCAGFADKRHWMVPVTAWLSTGALARVDALLDRLLQPADNHSRPRQT